LTEVTFKQQLTTVLGKQGDNHIHSVRLYHSTAQRHMIADYNIKAYQRDGRDKHRGMNVALTRCWPTVPQELGRREQDPAGTGKKLRTGN
jgi:hypothetical protein